MHRSNPFTPLHAYAAANSGASERLVKVIRIGGTGDGLPEDDRLLLQQGAVPVEGGRPLPLAGCLSSQQRVTVLIVQDGQVLLEVAVVAEGEAAELLQQGV